MSETFAFDVRQGVEIADAVGRNGGTRADLKAMSTGDMFTRILPILRGYGEVVIIKVLQLLDTILVPATTEKFVAKEKLVVNMSETAEVKISFVSDNVTDWYLSGDGLIEESFAGSTLNRHVLIKKSLDPLIILGLGVTRSITSWTEAYSLMKRQPKGEALSEGMLNNGWGNISYIPQRVQKVDDNHFSYVNRKGKTITEEISDPTFLFEVNGKWLVLRAVDVHWHGGGWRLDAYSVLRPIEWDAGDQVFSRSYSETLAQAQA